MGLFYAPQLEYYVKWKTLVLRLKLYLISVVLMLLRRNECLDLVEKMRRIRYPCQKSRVDPHSRQAR